MAPGACLNGRESAPTRAQRAQSRRCTVLGFTNLECNVTSALAEGCISKSVCGVANPGVRTNEPAAPKRRIISLVSSNSAHLLRTAPSFSIGKAPNHVTVPKGATSATFLGHAVLAVVGCLSECCVHTSLSTPIPLAEFISPEHEKSVNAGLHSPGPAVYDSKSSLNEQVTAVSGRQGITADAFAGLGLARADKRR